MTPDIQAFFEPQTSTVTYLVSDPITQQAVIIDPVLDFDPKSARTTTRSAGIVLDAAQRHGLSIKWVLETHAHADHLTAANYLKEVTGAQVAIGEHIKTVQRFFAPVFEASDLKCDGLPFDRLLADGDVLIVGGLTIEVIYTPGHTPGCVSYKIGANVFVGDTLFMPDYGTARADFPGGDAEALYHSIRKILAMPHATNLWMCHDYLPENRQKHSWHSTVADERLHNIHIHDGISLMDFVATRTARDKTLPAPALLLPSIQVNIRAGHMPPESTNGQVYLKIPINRL